MVCYITDTHNKGGANPLMVFPINHTNTEMQGHPCNGIPSIDTHIVKARATPVMVFPITDTDDKRHGHPCNGIQYY